MSRVKIAGVYEIIFSDGSRYIGSTSDFYARRQKHISAFENQKRPASTLQSAYRNNGYETPVFRLLEVVEAVKDSLLEAEERHIQLAGMSNLLNKQSIPHNSWLGRKRTPENIQKQIEDSMWRATPVLQTKLDGSFVALHRSINEAARVTGVTATKICACCKGHRKSASGYKWVYDDSGEIARHTVRVG